MSESEDLDARWIVDRALFGRDRGELEDLAPDEFGEDILISYVEGTLDAPSTRVVWEASVRDDTLRARLVELGEELGVATESPQQAKAEVVRGPGSWRRGWKIAVSAAALLLCVAAGFRGGHARGHERGRAEGKAEAFIALLGRDPGPATMGPLVLSHLQLRTLMDRAAQLGMADPDAVRETGVDASYSGQARMFLYYWAFNALDALSKVAKDAEGDFDAADAERLIRLIEEKHFPR